MSDYYDRDGHPTTLERWRQIGARVAATDIQDGPWAGCRVSTVLIGTDAEQLYETMILGGIHDGWNVRYPTEWLAVCWHVRIVEKLERGETP